MNKIFIFLSLNYYINKMISLLPTINKSNLLHLNFFLNCNLCNLTSTLQLFLVFKVFTNFPAPLLLGYTCLRKFKIKNFMGYPRFLTHQNSLRPRAIADCPSHLVSSSVLSSLHGLNFFLETHFDVPPRSIPCFPSPPPLFRSVEGLNWYSILYSLPLRIFVGWLSQRGSLSIISSLHGFNYCSVTNFDVPARSPSRPRSPVLFLRTTEGWCCFQFQLVPPREGKNRARLGAFSSSGRPVLPTSHQGLLLAFPHSLLSLGAAKDCGGKWTIISMNEKVSNNGNLCNYWTSGKGKGFL